MDLKKNGIVPQNATISDAINQITESAINGPDGKIASLDSEFEGFAATYTTNSALLAGYVDTLETKLEKISDTYMSYENDKAMVKNFVSQIDAKTRAADSPATKTSNDVSTIASKLTKLIGNRDFNTFVTDFKKKFGSIAVSSLPQLTISQYNYHKQLEEANKHLKATKALLAL